MKLAILTLFSAFTTQLAFADGASDTTQTVPPAVTTLTPETSAAITDSVNENPAFSDSQNKVEISSEPKELEFGIPSAGKPATSPMEKWDRVLPFFGQQVILNGYDLPLPFGISFVYANVQQDVAITDLAVGFRGSKKVDIDFVTFDNNQSNMNTPQLKLDAWVLPFMNVFATVGKLKGSVDIGLAIDGNDALDQLGKDCSKPRPGPLCNALSDKRLEMDIEASLTGMTYSTGVMFVGAWHSYFLSVPITYSWTDMDRSKTDGRIISILPRVGKHFPFNNGSSLSVYAGASYLNSELTLTGSQPIPGTGESIDYQVDQENIDKWMGLVGGNYNLTKRWSLAFEYGGIGSGGSRKQFITNLTYRY